MPSRDLFETPTLLDASTKGDGLGFRFALGAAYRFLGSFGVGLSYLSAHGKTILTAKTHDDGTELLRQTKASTSHQLIVGARGTVLKGRATGVFTMRLPSVTTVKGESVLPILNNATIDNSGTAHGPLGLGLGATGRVWRGLAPFVEVLYQRWASLDEQVSTGAAKASVAFRDTLDLALGLDVEFLGQTINGAFGLYESPLADGVMKERADDGVEKVGMKLPNVDAMPRRVFAAGWSRNFLKKLHLQTGFSYQTGSRSVGENARGYGDYELTIVTVIAAGTYRL